jgi:hypothetical protein
MSYTQDFQRRATVVTPCNSQRTPVDEVEFLDISEGMQGEDRLTYKCPHCGWTHTGTVYG